MNRTFVPWTVSIAALMYLLLAAFELKCQPLEIYHYSSGQSWQYPCGELSVNLRRIYASVFPLTTNIFLGAFARMAVCAALSLLLNFAFTAGGRRWRARHDSLAG